MDGGFNTGVFQNYDLTGSILSVAQQPNGKLIVSGMFHSLDGVAANNVVRLETTGVKDAGFAAMAAGPHATNVSVVLVRPSDSEIFAGGYFSTYGGATRNNLAWVNGDGSVDSTFTGLAGATDFAPQIYAFGTQTDGKIVVGGFFNSFNGASHYNIVRLNPDSTIDPSFNANLGTYGSVRAIHIQPDGKILIAGNFIAVNGIARGGVARLNTDGTLDPSFDPGTGANGLVYGITQDSAGNVYVVGAFDTFNGALRLRVAKLSSTGALDPVFNQAGGGASSTVFAVAPPDGAGGIVIGGQFTTYNGQTARRIARLDVTTGALDQNFTPPLLPHFSGTVFALALAPDGKYYAGGSFTSYNGGQRSRVARLNADGSLDVTFVPPANNGIVWKLALQHGKVFVGGAFTNPAGRIVRLTSTGALDSTFVNGTGIDTVSSECLPGRPGGHRARHPGGQQTSHRRNLQSVQWNTPHLSRAPDRNTCCSNAISHADWDPWNSHTYTDAYHNTTPPPSPTPPPTPTPTPTPGATPATLGNISTRLRVETGDNVLDRRIHCHRHATEEDHRARHRPFAASGGSAGRSCPRAA